MFNAKLLWCIVRAAAAYVDGRCEEMRQGEKKCTLKGVRTAK